MLHCVLKSTHPLREVIHRLRVPIQPGRAQTMKDPSSNLYWCIMFSVTSGFGPVSHHLTLPGTYQLIVLSAADVPLRHEERWRKQSRGSRISRKVEDWQNSLGIVLASGAATLPAAVVADVVHICQRGAAAKGDGSVHQITRAAPRRIAAQRAAFHPGERPLLLQAQVFLRLLRLQKMAKWRYNVKSMSISLKSMDDISLHQKRLYAPYGARIIQESSQKCHTASEITR